MTYANTIEALQYMRRNSCEEFVDDLTAAIDLMRAAEASVSADIRALSQSIAVSVGAAFSAVEGGEVIARALVIAREAGKEQALDLIEQACSADKSELTTAQAEIERLRALLNDADDAYLADCKTKLTNLREAVEYVENLLGDGRDAMPPTAAKRMLRAAIEASR